MKKFTVFIEGSNKTINLQESILTTSYSYLLVKKATIFWEYENIPQGTMFEDRGLSSNSAFSITTLSPGYYTFNDIADRLNHKLERTPCDGKCKMTTNTTHSLNLDNKLMELLGFKSGFFDASTTTKSDEQVNINNGLKYVKVRCNIVDNQCNINEMGKKDDTIVSLPITSTQPLFGSVQSYFDIESKIHIDNGVINQLHFSVTDQDEKPINIGKILLECYLM